jgi:hypothetical protein
MKNCTARIFVFFFFQNQWNLGFIMSDFTRTIYF